MFSRRTIYGPSLRCRLTFRYEFDLYREKSLSFYTILMSYADEVQAVSIDEALVDVTQRVLELEQAPPELNEQSDSVRDYSKLLAEDIRADMREATDCEGEQHSFGIVAGLDLILCNVMQLASVSQATYYSRDWPLDMPNQRGLITSKQTVSKLSWRLST